ncbi:lysophospholipid acyltransferase family protein [Variovorax paradoxus]|jgi:KDO2-lipid IV(A) lauroyltransferase|uniref:lysophospholipid acyltransferase family protein n=1 Tax=Variovorax paradoxus TaxID=34073 RepID=UPI0029C997F1|nr:lysophospholipid acyltransferase family protein [Variovorax paradoxus]WPH21608.1 lysophospholipid acyltransferase family protein [Variovorax paradoxus]
MVTLFRLLARVPMPVMHRLGALLGWIVWYCAPDYRRRFKANAESAGFTPGQYRPAIAAAGQMAAELPWLWLRPQGESVLRRVVRWEGVEAFEAAMREKKGVILVAPHLGSWEMCGQAIGERFLETFGPITALFRPARKKWMADLIAAGSRDRPGLQTLPTNNTGVRGLIRTLRSGGYTGILPDQVPPLGQGVWAPFLGRPAYTMTLLPRLAQQTGAACFLSVCERLPRSAGYVIRFEPIVGTPLTDPAAPIEAAAAAMNDAIGRLIHSLPGQYVWDYARYKEPRGETAVAAQSGEQAR